MKSKAQHTTVPVGAPPEISPPTIVPATTTPFRTAARLLLLFTTLLFLVGCKPKQIITEKVMTTTDSTAVLSLKAELHAKEIQIENLKTDLKRIRDENIRLQSEASSHIINYDTTAPVDPQTGKYPIASETITQSKSQIDKTISEFEILNQKYNNQINKLAQENQNLEYTLEALKEENHSLKEKITPTTGFNFRLFFAGMIFVVVLIAIGFKFNILTLKKTSRIK
jgi:cell division protein FtsB